MLFVTGLLFLSYGKTNRRFAYDTKLFGCVTDEDSEVGRDLGGRFRSVNDDRPKEGTLYV